MDKFRRFGLTIPTEKWNDAFDNKTIADAVLDRLVCSSHYHKRSGASLRQKVRDTK
ncbi:MULTISPECIES: ATP-binding protein [unclassified Undibacterium]|uniref:ATP-binding protein n=1 Tax=unclassified Undibacterium TaxID=2630295 RepID=UPI0033956071